MISMSMTSITMDMNTITSFYLNGIEAHKKLINIIMVIVDTGTVFWGSLNFQFYVDKPNFQ